jgi:ArsR family transcriptional regulator
MKKIERIEESCRRPLLELPFDELRAEQMADALRVVADSARLRILNLIASKNPEESWAGELTEALGLSQQTVSHHLRVLHDAGLIERDRRGIAPTTPWLANSSTCCGIRWHPERRWLALREESNRAS